VVRNPRHRGGNSGVVRRELYANALVDAQSHAVGPSRNEKVVGSIPTGGSTSDQRKRWSDLSPKLAVRDDSIILRRAKDKAKPKVSRGEIETLPAPAPSRTRSMPGLTRSPRPSCTFGKPSQPGCTQRLRPRRSSPDSHAGRQRRRRSSGRKALRRGSSRTRDRPRAGADPQRAELIPVPGCRLRGPRPGGRASTDCLVPLRGRLQLSLRSRTPAGTRVLRRR
jgi:hypothetical protein